APLVNFLPAISIASSPASFNNLDDPISNANAKYAAFSSFVANRCSSMSYTIVIFRTYNI
ncbi:MAG: hypothetical protein VB130_05190, partial [Clostridium sp.]|nr:hypothetical protein [Clostridium sp.]